MGKVYDFLVKIDEKQQYFEKKLKHTLNNVKAEDFNRLLPSKPEKERLSKGFKEWVNNTTLSKKNQDRYDPSYRKKKR